MMTYHLSILATAYLQAGAVDKGLATLQEAFTLVERTGERFWEAELQRLQGELLLQLSAQNAAAAEAALIFADHKNPRHPLGQRGHELVGVGRIVGRGDIIVVNPALSHKRIGWAGCSKGPDRRLTAVELRLLW